jgi:hypothetical protein
MTFGEPRYSAGYLAVLVSRCVNKPRRLLQSAIVLCVVAGITPSAFASGTGPLTFGNPFPGASHTNTHQIVKMVGAAGRLAGRPHFGSVVMITAYAPGCADGEIVIGEKAAEGNSTVLQIASSYCLQENLVQATLFLRNRTPRARFAKSGEHGWVECPVRDIPLPTSVGLDHSALPWPAVVVDDLSLIELSEEHTGETAPAGLRLPWNADLGTRMSRAGWHILWPAVALVIFVLLSWSVHRTKRPLWWA